MTKIGSFLDHPAVLAVAAVLVGVSATIKLAYLKVNEPELFDLILNYAAVGSAVIAAAAIVVGFLIRINRIKSNR